MQSTKSIVESAKSMYKYIFGPVPSRRLGLSLGVDIIPPKLCTLDCIYCEVGATDKRGLARKEYFPAAEISGGNTACSLQSIRISIISHCPVRASRL